MEYAVLNNSAFRREVAPGTPEEYKVVSVLKSVFEEYCDWVKLVSVPTSSWIERECFIEIAGKVVKCHAMPYVDKAVIEGKVVWVRYENDVLRVRGGNLSGAIAFTPFPEDFDAVNHVVLELAASGVSGVVFYDDLWNAYRRFVVVGSPHYSFTSGSPPPVPVVSVLYSDVAGYAGSGDLWVRLYVDALTKHGLVGKIVVAGINGSGESEMHVTAHHDHWFTGFSDNLVGVEVLVQLAKRAENWRGANVVLVSYTSEEIGAPNYASWYWAWGSRYYLRILRENSALDSITANVNIDAVYRQPFEIYANPSLKPCIDKVAGAYNADYRGFDHMDFDSFSYTLSGVPAMTITTLNTIKPVYHSSVDDGMAVEPGIVERAAELAWRILECVDAVKPSYKHLADYVKARLDDSIPLEGRVLIAKLENLNRLVESERERIAIATRRLVQVAYIPGFKPVHTVDLLAAIQLLRDLADKVENYTGRSIRLYSFDTVVFDAVITKYNAAGLKSVLFKLLSEKLLETSMAVDEEISAYTFRRLLDKHLKNSFKSVNNTSGVD